MRNQNPYEEMVAYGIGGVIALLIIYYWWTYIVGLLALCGAYCVFQEYQRGKNNRRR
ncbi:MAG: hypothetical protein AB9869_25030 [Verrucomicrobiia bacterium]